jgi:hypothetical protein
MQEFTPLQVEIAEVVEEHIETLDRILEDENLDELIDAIPDTVDAYCGCQTCVVRETIYKTFVELDARGIRVGQSPERQLHVPLDAYGGPLL